MEHLFSKSFILYCVLHKTIRYSSIAFSGNNLFAGSSKPVFNPKPNAYRIGFSYWKVIFSYHTVRESILFLLFFFKCHEDCKVRASNCLMISSNFLKATNDGLLLCCFQNALNKGDLVTWEAEKPVVRAVLADDFGRWKMPLNSAMTVGAAASMGSSAITLKSATVSVGNSRLL